MKEVAVDGFGWRLPDDVHVGFLSPLGAPEWHGHSLDALRDSIGGGSINDIEPPFRITVWSARDHPRAVGDLLKRIDGLFADIRRERGVEVRLQVRHVARPAGG